MSKWSLGWRVAAKAAALCVIFVLAWIVFMPVEQPMWMWKRSAALSNIRQVALAHIMYREDFDGFAPSTTNQAEIRALIWHFFVRNRPEDRVGGWLFKIPLANGIATPVFNTAIAGINEKDVKAPSTLMTIFSQYNAQSYVVSFWDGHSKLKSPGDFNQTWETSTRVFKLGPGMKVSNFRSDLQDPTDADFDPEKADNIAWPVRK